MRVSFTLTAWDEYQWWQEHDRKVLKRINQLSKDTLRSPFEGLGKPEALRGDLSGHWSRRITDEHRLVYEATEAELLIVACRFHYGD